MVGRLNPIRLLSWLWPDTRKGSYPETTEAAVDEVEQWLDDESRVYIATSTDEGLGEFHWGLGMAIRNELGLWDSGSTLSAACGEKEADEASMVILEALRDRLAKNATAKQLAAGHAARAQIEAQCEAEREAYLKSEALNDARFTSRVCRHCDQPLPTYRKTCRRCGRPAEPK